MGRQPSSIEVADDAINQRRKGGLLIKVKIWVLPCSYCETLSFLCVIVM